LEDRIPPGRIEVDPVDRAFQHILMNSIPT
jgi:hypothetical protein